MGVATNVKAIFGSCRFEMERSCGCAGFRPAHRVRSHSKAA